MLALISCYIVASIPSGRIGGLRPGTVSQHALRKMITSCVLVSPFTRRSLETWWVFEIVFTVLDYDLLGFSS